MITHNCRLVLNCHQAGLLKFQRGIGVVGAKCSDKLFTSHE